jgi:DNA-directed RNA polymerase specialized sigma subunit
MKKIDGLRECSRKCMKKKKECKEMNCRLWQDFPEEYNCTLVSVYEHGSMTLREVAEREHLSFARIKQIETQALKKLKSLNLIGCFRF